MVLHPKKISKVNANGDLNPEPP